MSAGAQAAQCKNNRRQKLNQKVSPHRRIHGQQGLKTALKFIEDENEVSASKSSFCINLSAVTEEYIQKSDGTGQIYFKKEKSVLCFIRVQNGTM